MNQYYHSVKFCKELQQTSQISSHYPAGKELGLFQDTFQISYIIHTSPIPDIPMFYFDGSLSGKVGIIDPSLTTTLWHRLQFFVTSKFSSLIYLLACVSLTLLTLFVFPGIIIAPRNAHNLVVQYLLQQLQAMLQRYSEPIMISFWFPWSNDIRK